MRKSTVWTWLAAMALLVPLAVQAPRAQTLTVASPDASGARVIVKYKADSLLVRKGIQSASREQAEALRASQVQALGQRIGIALAPGAGIGERTAVVFASGMTSAALAARLAAEGDIEYAVPDLRRHHYALPNDPLYQTRPYDNASTPTAGGPLVGQWYLKPPGPAGTGANTAPSAINAQDAWDLTTGSASIVVAVLDTGVRFDHEDLKTVVNGGNLLAGYDMISQDVDGTYTTANDGNGRDADASDPGDYVLQADSGKGGCTSADVGSLSSWHGTETAGLIGALTDNHVGVASVGRTVRILPVRVLGKCGGYDSDILAGMIWAAGLAVPGVPTNTTPARVINMSLGGVGSCTQAYVDALAQVNAAGTVVVASAGNSAGHAVSTPANCPGVIGVAGVRHIGTKVGFSDLGPQISISAPGGNCINLGATTPCLYPIITTSNAGATTPVSAAMGGSTYSDSFGVYSGTGYRPPSLGTSFSAPLVAGTAALMLSVQPQLTPDEVRYKLQQTARAFPTSPVDEGGATVPQCTAPTGADQLQCVCKTGLCGAGMLDAHAAVVAAGGIQARITVTPATPTIGQPVTFSSAASIVPGGHMIVSYQWTLSDGGGIVAALTGPTDGPSVTATPSAGGRFVVTLTAADSTGQVSAESQTVTVPGPPPSSGGDGGGAVGIGWLLGLLAAIAALAFAPINPQQRRGR